VKFGVAVAGAVGVRVAVEVAVDVGVLVLVGVAVDVAVDVAVGVALGTIKGLPVQAREERNSPARAARNGRKRRGRKTVGMADLLGRNACHGSSIYIGFHTGMKRNHKDHECDPDCVQYFISSS